jgi:hypothetical protein
MVFIRLVRFHRRGGKTWRQSIRIAGLTIWNDIVDPMRIVP